MKIKEIEIAIENIRSVSNDPEVAHDMEDELYEAFIRHLAGMEDQFGKGNIGRKARLILSTKDIKFERWCA